jgi:hypothetical protein
MEISIAKRIILTNLATRLAVFCYAVSAQWLVRLNERRRVEKAILGRLTLQSSLPVLPYGIQSLDKGETPKRPDSSFGDV